MKILILAALVAAMLALAGCAQTQGSPSDALASADSAAKPAPGGFAPQDAPVVVPKEPEPAAPAAVENAPPPAAPAQPTGCAALLGSEQTDCVFMKARDAKDVTVCTSELESSAQRFSCITQWCASEARDFNQCENLSGDDRLGCLNKCNPNPNT